MTITKGFLTAAVVIVCSATVSTTTLPASQKLTFQDSLIHNLLPISKTPKASSTSAITDTSTIQLKILAADVSSTSAPSPSPAFEKSKMSLTTPTSIMFAKQFQQSAANISLTSDIFPTSKIPKILPTKLSKFPFTPEISTIPSEKLTITTLTVPKALPEPKTSEAATSNPQEPVLPSKILVVPSKQSTVGIAEILTTSKIPEPLSTSSSEIHLLPEILPVNSTFSSFPVVLPITKIFKSLAALPKPNISSTTLGNSTANSVLPRMGVFKPLSPINSALRTKSIGIAIPKILSAFSASPKLYLPLLSSPLPTTIPADGRNFINFDVKSIVTNFASFARTLPKAIINDADALTPELAANHGYDCETHKVVTSDGYVLTLHRIPPAKEEASTNTQVILLLHGLSGSSADWIIANSDRSLGYILADAGYDVWMGNNRGNVYSRMHESLDPDGERFWDFSWHEIGVFDLRAMIDYVLEHTNQEDLYFAGYSQGTTAFYVLCTEIPEYNQKIKAMFSLAPIAYMSHISSPLFYIIARAEPIIGILQGIIGLHEFLPKDTFISQIGRYLCARSSVTQILCTNYLFTLCGFSNKQMNTTLLSTMMGHTPAGSSTKQVLHYAQLMTTGRFCRYDYGRHENKKRYGRKVPPRYHLHRISAPVYIYYSRHDWLADERDIRKLSIELGNPQPILLVDDDSFNHLDFMYGIDAHKLVYKFILERMKEIAANT